MNSDHAPTAEEQLPPLDEKYVEMTEDLGTEDGDSDVMVRLALDCRERQLLAALRENREMKARNAELEVLERTVKFMSDSYLEEHGNWGICKWRVHSEAAEAKLCAVSDALEEKEKLQHWTPEGWPWPYYVKPEVDAIFARIRAIVEGK